MRWCSACCSPAENDSSSDMMSFLSLYSCEKVERPYGMAVVLGRMVIGLVEEGSSI